MTNQHNDLQASTDDDDLPEERFPEEPIPTAEETTTTDPDLNTENIQPNSTEMEVHHHAHQSHGKKTWRSYFWEFLMLFLAVFCGFLAEYQLEHYIEKQRATDFATSLKSDLIRDTTEIRKVIERLEFCSKKVDTLITVINDPVNLQKNTPEIYAYNIFAFIFPLTTPNEATLQQLLNSGSLRYFRNNDLVDSIKGYNNRLQTLKKIAESTTDFTIDFRKEQLAVVDIRSVVKEIAKATGSSANYFRTTSYEENRLAFGQDQLLTNDPKQLKEFSNWCALKMFYINNSISMYKRIFLSAENLLKILNK